jgi:putative cell wall-binding protein
VLLTETGSVPARTLDALRDSGAGTVYLLGGTAAISDAVAAQLAATPSYDCTGVRGAALQVVRLFGADRFDTARRIAEYAGTGAVGTSVAPGTSRPLRTAVVASGLGFADALAAGPLSYAGAATTTYGSGRGFPTLLTGSAALSPEVESALRDLGIEQVLLPGGTGVVSAAVQSRLEALGLNVIRLAGTNRSETAVAVARFAVESLGFPRSEVALARGDAFADALAGAAYAGKRTAPLLLTAGPTTLGDATRDYLLAGGDLTNSLTVFGGEGAVSTGTLNDALRSLLG